MKHVEHRDKNVRSNIPSVSTNLNGSDNAINVEVLGWEPHDLNIPNGCGIEGCGGGTEEESKESAFRKSYNACVPDCVRTTARTYLAIGTKWFTRYFVYEPEKICDRYIDQFSTCYRQFCIICGPYHDHGSCSMDERQISDIYSLNTCQNVLNKMRSVVFFCCG